MIFMNEHIITLYNLLHRLRDEHRKTETHYRSHWTTLNIVFCVYLHKCNI